MKIAPLRQHGPLFLDPAGAEMLLRGVNLGGDCKVPYPDGGTEYFSDFSDHRDVSFIGRPFPLDEADEHLGRLAHWGFNIVRLLTTWEAVEHKGPGDYDTAYLDYLAEVTRRAGEYGLHVFIDFHQDVWSRMTGGDGAPGWTFEAAGLDFTKFTAADSAHVMQARYNYRANEPRQASYPQMSWGSNHRLPASAIMWTLFWGGRHFAPGHAIDGENAGDFLQRHYLGAMNEVARRVADLPNVIGFDTLNEPGLGWLNQPLSYRHLAASAANSERPRIGPALSPLDALGVARGIPVTVPVLTRDPSGAAVPSDARTINPGRVSIWREGIACPFERAGAYRLSGDSLIAGDDDFFRTVAGHRLSLAEDIFAPFYERVATTIRKHNERWSVFAEMDAFAHAAGRHFPRRLPERTVEASHWYDVSTLYLKKFNVEGEDRSGIAARYRRQLSGHRQEATGFPNGGAPALIGECGIPFDLNSGAAYEAWRRGVRDGIWVEHEAALTALYDALDALGLHATQWNYTASNRNDLRIGDRWNQEDLSIFSRDQQDDPSDPDSGGRAIAGFCRPYARRIQGRARRRAFDAASRIMTLDYEADPRIFGGTEIFVPRFHYPHGVIIRCEGVPSTIYRSPADQTVTVTATASGPMAISIIPAQPA